MMEEEKKQMKSVLSQLKYEDVVAYASKSRTKSANKSEMARIAGNKLFQLNQHLPGMHEAIWQKYMLSMMLAPSDSEELATAYANRSALLFHMARFRDCIKDVDRAVDIVKSSLCKAKWLCRKVKCWHALEDSKNAENTMLQVMLHFRQVERECVDKIKVWNLIEKTQKFLETKNLKHCEIIKDPNLAHLKLALHDYSGVSVKYDQKFGKHLLANRDFAPGEVVFSEEPYYTSMINEVHPNPYCYHCRVFCLTTIPCDGCTWCIFCSEKCKNDAWKQYHDIECLVQIDEAYILTSIQSIVHVLTVELRKCGSISNLKSYLKLIDQKKDNFRENLIIDGKLQVSKFELLYSICNEIAPEYRIHNMDIALNIMISLAIHTPFFGKKFKMYEWKNLLKHEDVEFISSLILKLVNVTSQVLALTKIRNYFQNPDNKDDSFLGNCLPAVHCLINHSCDSNVNKFVTIDNKLVVFALKPIKKNEQILTSYTNSFRGLPKFLRQKNLKESLGFVCDCRACKENWLPLYEIGCNEIKLNIFVNQSKLLSTPLEKRLYEKHKVELFNNCFYRHDFDYQEERIQQLAQSITIAMREMPQPSIMTSLLITTLNLFFVQLYARSYQLPDKCVN